MVSLLLLTSDPHLSIAIFVQAIRSDHLLADAVGSPFFASEGRTADSREDCLDDLLRESLLCGAG